MCQDLVNVIILAFFFPLYSWARSKCFFNHPNAFCVIYLLGSPLKRPNYQRASAIEPAMYPNEKQLLFRYLTGINNYFEFGSGGSTAQAAIRAKYVVSVENDAAWHAHLRNLIGPCTNIVWYTVDHQVPFGSWGRPGRNSSRAAWSNYTHAYNAKYHADVILIDGRFRVSCAMCVFSEITEKTFVVMHDFPDRRHYWVVLNWYDLIELADRLAVFTRKSGVAPPTQEMINWYDQQPYDGIMPGLTVPDLPKPRKPG
jgi:hypothetical protein